MALEQQQLLIGPVPGHPEVEHLPRDSSRRKPLLELFADRLTDLDTPAFGERVPEENQALSLRLGGVGLAVAETARVDPVLDVELGAHQPPVGPGNVAPAQLAVELPGPRPAVQLRDTQGEDGFGEKQAAEQPEEGERPDFRPPSNRGEVSAGGVIVRGIRCDRGLDRWREGCPERGGN